ncbi:MULTISPECIES: cytochrome c biogenesis heme-transporting ATPase CcmA [unclassified Salinivibrio]|uniref:cytochrome c biogenesis heme-transporting ATPase CcmA n=1 Tax=unclassified Salinivibrio TaxID=2636825 RepID=UPI00128CBD5C|nr:MULTISPECIES: cytochrome c biogenesis heme-transporting ATPase CcmA [unclassified Salinivibrio]MPS32922.1 cytochrome c biogenesis heme-transporting ATPase CcmA [Salinivibrio sp. VYel7]MPX91174.1 cytochrome c biogenesis heme-transporting ATPase CcmA [Salinivibrio sp. VYel1]MPX94309.1 cytochrome c biogenesis heme-transporting ATPase CcmA [Salinivibrio sp. VYel9]MPX96213.1 cytochrome c biogenesis heme-transporting ATPase CcmA [Salinivibrio sp. VYel6]MPY00595.1 cytochrome c biogenesis heme-tran
MLEVKQLCCVRDDRVLFDALTFSLAPGDLVQVEGPNGAGKTTLLRIIAGLGLADSGEVCWQQQAITQQRDAFYRDLLFLGHTTGVKRELTAFENLAYYMRMHGRCDHDAIWQALAKVGLAGREDIPAGQLSAGQNRRVALARLWLSDRRLWILDEPLTAIDKQGVKVLEAVFERHVQQGGMVLFTTHQDMFVGHPLLRRIRLGAQ